MNSFDKDLNLYNKLKEYADSDSYPFHMPGHKRNTNMLGVSLPFSTDITEIDGFDNLHNADGILKNSAEKAKYLFHSENSYVLVNGSTCGLLSAIRSVTNYGDEIIVARNCHKSVYNGCLLNNIEIHFVYPPQDKHSGVSGSISPESIRQALENYPNAKAVVITSPTYEGVISDTSAIAEVSHSFGVPLIVDNAHGVHLPFCKFCKGDPVRSGADIVVSSLHKTLPTLTQTAVAHVNGNLVNPKNFAYQLAIFETSSPSYVLMSSADNCFDFIMTGENYFREYENNLLEFSKEMDKLKHLRILCHGADRVENHGFYAFDFGKIVICTSGTNINGVELMQILRSKYRIELEMSYPFYAVAMTSVCDTKDGFRRLANALLEIDEALCGESGNTVPILEMPIPRKSGIKPSEILQSNGELTTANGERISRSYIYAYPPGVPIAVPGEIIDEQLEEYIRQLRISNVDVFGI